MNHGQVYVWEQEPASVSGGRIRKAVVPLPRVTGCLRGPTSLSGEYVTVTNAGWVRSPDAGTASPLGPATPDAGGHFIFEPGRGGGRMDKTTTPDRDFCWRYVQAARFGEVNTYYHVDLIAEYVDDLLMEIGAASLPRVTAVVNAHHSVAEINGRRDGVAHGDHWVAFQGGHYRLPGPAIGINEDALVSPDGEIHLGPGRGLTEHGALAETAGGRYRMNASHNAGIIYHEYGHHITRHTADLRANRLRPCNDQDNRKTALDEGTCDYWTAVMLGSPHIWSWHRRHDESEVHPRSLTSTRTMADYKRGPTADVHENGTIWAAALWRLREAAADQELYGGRNIDRLVIKALLIIGEMTVTGDVNAVAVRRARRGFGAGMVALKRADTLLYGKRYACLIDCALAKSGIHI